MPKIIEYIKNVKLTKMTEEFVFRQGMGIREVMFTRILHSFKKYIGTGSIHKSWIRRNDRNTNTKGIPSYVLSSLFTVYSGNVLDKVSKNININIKINKIKLTT